MSAKRFHLSAGQIRPIVTGRGSCYATDRITVDGARVGLLYREPPDSASASGWHCMAGDESPEYCEDPQHWGTYDVNTLANCDARIIPFLDQPPGSEYDLDANGELVRSSSSLVDALPVLTIPDFEGAADLDASWSADFPRRFFARVEGDRIALWRGGVNVWIQAWDTSKEGFARVAAHAEEQIPVEAFERILESESGLRRILYRTKGGVPEPARPPLTALVINQRGLLNITAGFWDEADLPMLIDLVRSVRQRGD